MTRTITIFFDTSDSDNLGYSAQLDIPGRPGVAEEPAVSLTPARRCASGPKPPAAVVKAARAALGLGDAAIDWERLDTDNGWRGTCGAGPVVKRSVRANGGFKVDAGPDGVPYADDLGGGVYRLSARGERIVMWSRNPSLVCARFAGAHQRGMGEWRT